MTERRRPSLREAAWSARWVIATAVAWLAAELVGVFSRRDGDTWTEWTRWLMGAHPLVGWALGGAWTALCLWLVPHYLLPGIGWRWLVWAVIVCVTVAMATYGLMVAGFL